MSAAHHSMAEVAPLSTPPSHIWAGALDGWVGTGVREISSFVWQPWGPPCDIRRKSRAHSTPCRSPGSRLTHNRRPGYRSPGRREGHSRHTRQIHSSNSRGMSPPSCRSRRWRSPRRCCRASGTHRTGRTGCSGHSNLPVPGEGLGRMLTGCSLCSSSCLGWPEMDGSATSGGPWGHPEHRSPNAWYCLALRGGHGPSHLAVVGCSPRGSPEAGMSQLLWRHGGQCCSGPGELQNRCPEAWGLPPPPRSPLLMQPPQSAWIPLLPPAQEGGTRFELRPGLRWRLHGARRS